ncbi:cytochrome c oxidase subunit 2A [Calditerricola satsumensis]|uniref:Cytochrome c oxidase subunit 2A n=1 Tax=Calditerricola satsumensis TaxID=373054 RepID=A0A8J3B660_9BACI|nr:cytochrome c oxidase subunit 2A [Calditerricola satsumensis]GGJ98423.1 hypothetical protein GCM10007043_10430 [Calditerricola satsumensis]
MKAPLTRSQPQHGERPAAKEEGQNLKGTFVFALGLGAFILLSWLSVYLLYLSR